MIETDRMTEKVLEKWMPITSRATRASINRILRGILDDVRDGKVGLGSLVHRMVNDLGWLTNIAPEALTAGIGMYYMMSYMSFKVHGQVINEPLIYYTCLLYVDLDYILDSSSEDKDRYIHDVKQFLLYEKTCIRKNKALPPIRHKVVNGVPQGNRYVWCRKLIEHNTMLIDPIMELFSAEVHSYRFQRVGISRKKLLRITYSKAKTTNDLLCAILNITNIAQIKAFAHAGYISQLLDDMYDIENDNRDNIETLATYDLRMDGNMDRTFSLAIGEIGEMKRDLNELRMMFLATATYIPTKSRVLSMCMYHTIEPYILVDARMLW